MNALFPRPWRVEADEILDANGRRVLQFDDEFSEPEDRAVEVAVAQLIVSAVNAFQTPGNSPEVTAPPFTIHESTGDVLVDAAELQIGGA